MKIDTDLGPEPLYTGTNSENIFHSPLDIYIIVAIFPVIFELSKILQHIYVESMLINFVEFARIFTT